MLHFKKLVAVSTVRQLDTDVKLTLNNSFNHIYVFKLMMMIYYFYGVNFNRVKRSCLLDIVVAATGVNTYSIAIRELPVVTTIDKQPKQIYQVLTESATGKLAKQHTNTKATAYTYRVGT